MIEQEQGGGASGGDVTIRQQASERLIQVTREHLAVRAVVDRLAIDRRSSGYRLPPRAGHRRDDRAGERLVLARLDHVRGQVVTALQHRRLCAGKAGEARRRPAQRQVVTGPAGQVRQLGQAQRPGQRSASGGDRLGLGTAEAECQRHLVAAARSDVLGRRDVAVGCRVVAGQRVRGGELGEAVARRPGVADAGRGRWAARAKRHVRGHRVAAVGRLGHGVGAVDHGNGGAGRGVDRPGVAARVRGATAAVPVDVRVQPRVQVQLADRSVRARRGVQPGVHQHGVPRRIGDVGGDQLVPMASAGRGHRAGHAGGVGRHGVGHVAGLQIGEGRAVGDDVLQRLHVRVVDRRLVHVGEHAASDRVPDLGRGVARGAEAVLAGQVEVRHRAWATGRGHGGQPGGGAGRTGWPGCGHREGEHADGDRRWDQPAQPAPGWAGRFPWPARACLRQSPWPARAYLRQSPHWNLRFPHWNPLAGRKCANRSERLLGPSLRTKDTVPKLPAAGPVVSTKKFVNGGCIRRPYAVCVSRGCRSCITELPVICHGRVMPGGPGVVPRASRAP